MVEVASPTGADNGLMLDPQEGLAPDGTIRTGAGRDQVLAEYEPVLRSAVAAFGEVSDRNSELHLYGSVATGMARLGVSEVDMLAIGVPAGWARAVSADLSRRFIDVSVALRSVRRRWRISAGKGARPTGGECSCITIVCRSLDRTRSGVRGRFLGMLKPHTGLTGTSQSVWTAGGQALTRGVWPARRCWRRQV